MTVWEGTAGAAQAKAILDEIAAKAFEKIQSASKGKLAAPGATPQRRASSSS